MTTLHSLQSMISWMFERCNRRFEDAMMVGDRDKAEGYNVRRALLVDFMQYLGRANDEQREMATEMLNSIDDLSSHEGSPSRDLDELRDTRRWKLQEGSETFVALQGLMFTQLQGCSSTSPTSEGDETWFSFGSYQHGPWLWPRTRGTCCATSTSSTTHLLLLCHPRRMFLKLLKFQKPQQVLKVL